MLEIQSLLACHKGHNYTVFIFRDFHAFTKKLSGEIVGDSYNIGMPHLQAPQ